MHVRAVILCSKLGLITYGFHKTIERKESDKFRMSQKLHRSKWGPMTGILLPQMRFIPTPSVGSSIIPFAIIGMGAVPDPVKIGHV